MSETLTKRYDPPNHYQYYGASSAGEPIAGAGEKAGGRASSSLPSSLPSLPSSTCAAASKRKPCRARAGPQSSAKRRGFASGRTVQSSSGRWQQSESPELSELPESSESPELVHECHGCGADKWVVVEGAPQDLQQDPPRPGPDVVADAIEMEETPPPPPGMHIHKLKQKEEKRSCFFRVPSLVTSTRSAATIASDGGDEVDRRPAEDGDGGAPPPPAALRDIWRGDIGLALFSPLDEAAFEPLKASSEPAPAADDEGGERPASAEPDERGDGDDADDDDDDDDDELPLNLVPESAAALKSNPRILTPSMMRQIRGRGLHPTVQLMSWTRAYSLQRDGDSFYAMLRMCEGYSHTIFAARTVRGDVLGGYADRPWAQTGGQVARTFYGSGRAFLFATDPAVDPDFYDGGGDGGGGESGLGEEAAEQEDRVQVYKWTGSNTYSQIFDAEGELLAMGGGGCFGIVVEENFTRGSTGWCATFNNPPLTRDLGGCFEIVDFEVYGLKSSLSLQF